MIKKLANKINTLLSSLKKKKPGSAQDAVMNTVIDKVTRDISQIAAVADKALDTVVKTAVEQAKVVEKSVGDKIPKAPKAPKAAAKPASKPAPADKNTSASSKAKGKPKKTTN